MRIASELKAEFERLRAPSRRHWRADALLRELGAADLDTLWSELASAPHPAVTSAACVVGYDAVCPGDRCRILARADDALAHRVDLLGSGPVELGESIDWLKDFKSGFDWPARYFRDIDYNNRERPSDVKVPWELSRLQWMIPAGQAYLLSGDERYALGVRAVLEQWIDSNPYAGTVNWACTMEVALRILTWTWFFHVFHGTRAWTDHAFRAKFLCALYLHVEFTERHIERSDVNGNHYTADAAGLVFGGLFFGKGRHAERWQGTGWAILSEEIERQVYADGVDFEASVAYHRLVTELFLLPALYRLKLGLSVHATYRERLEAMAHFATAYTKPDGTAPLWGDADDARALPCGGQGINDHRYLIGVVGAAFDNADLLAAFSGPREEVFWLLGKEKCESLPRTALVPASASFPDGGFYVMRGARDHVFIDCGPIGLAGRGGHGHNDCLAFEAVLDGIPLVSDCGAYVYTKSYAERNAFRSTAYHNTPQIDGEEINRFIRPDYLWNLHYDAVPQVVNWHVGERYVIFQGTHGGYHRLPSPVTPRRTILVDLESHALYVGDHFEGSGQHEICVPLHLAPGVEVHGVLGNELVLEAAERRFLVWWPPGSGYVLKVENARVSPSYGVALHTKRLVWRCGPAPLNALDLFIAPAEVGRSFETLVSRRLSRG
jgi:uncharacterized heparinase superfamily protein